MAELQLLARILSGCQLQNTRASFYVLMGFPGCSQLSLPLRRAGLWREITGVSFSQ